MGLLVDTAPCPFCGGETEVVEDCGRWAVVCLDRDGCGYSGGLRPTEPLAVDAHFAAFVDANFEVVCRGGES